LKDLVMFALRLSVQIDLKFVLCWLTFGCGLSFKILLNFKIELSVRPKLILSTLQEELLYTGKTCLSWLAVLIFLSVLNQNQVGSFVKGEKLILKKYFLTVKARRRPISIARSEEAVFSSDQKRFQESRSLPKSEPSRCSGKQEKDQSDNFFRGEQMIQLYYL